MPTQNMTEGVQGAPVHELTPLPTRKEEWVPFVENVYDYLKGFKTTLERHWRETMMFVANEQWIRFDNITNHFTRHNLDGWIPTPTTNKMVKPYDRIIDLLTNPDWRPKGRPASQDADDIAAAEVATRSLNYLFDKLETEELQLDLAAWLVITGNCIAFRGWDEDAGHIVRLKREILQKTGIVAPTGVCPACGAQHPAEFTGQVCPSCGQATLTVKTLPLKSADGQPLMEVRREQEKDEDGNPVFDELSVGEVTEAAVNPFNFYPQPRDDWKKVMYVDEVVAFDLDELVDVFGSNAKKVTAEDVKVDEQTGFINASRFQSHYYDRAQLPRRSMVRVHYFRHAPSSKFKNGKYVITANGVLLHEGDLDNNQGALPYEMAPYRKMPGELWGLGPLLDLVSLQKRINAIDSNIILNRKTMQNPRMLIPKGSGVTYLDGRPGLLIRYNPHNTGGAKPEILPPMGVSADTHRERETTANEFEDLAGTQEVLTGQAPPGIEAGIALNLLQEQALRRFGPSMKRWKRLLTRHERGKLLLIKDNWEEAREVEVAGDNMDTELFHYRGADLGDTTDVVVGMERGMLFSEAVQQQKLMMAAKAGWLGDLRNPAVKGRLLEKLGIEGFDSEYTLDAKKARRILRALRNGEQPLPPLPTDIHPIQFQILSDFTKTIEFEQLPGQIQQAILQRAMMHQQFMQQQAQQAMQQAVAAKGTDKNVSAKVAESGAMGNSEAQTQQVVPSAG